MITLLKKVERNVLIASLILVAVLIAFIIFAVLQNKYSKVTKANSLFKKKRSNYEFIFDFDKNEVVYLQRFHAKEQYKLTIDEFYHRIPDIRKMTMFKNWISELSKEKRSLLSEIEILLDDGKYVSLYFVQELDSPFPNKIHLTAYPITYQKSVKKKNTSILTGGISIETAYLRKYGNKGYMICIRFFPLDKELDTFKENIIQNEMRQVCLSFWSEVNTRIRISNEEPNLFVLCDYCDIKLQEYQTIISMFAKKLSSRLEFNGFSSFYDFMIGVAANNDFVDSVNCLETIKNKTYFTDSNSEKVQWYVKGNSEEIEKNLVRKMELDLLVNGRNKDRKIKITYCPLINMDDVSLLGFYGRCYPQSTTFDTLGEMFDQAHEENMSMQLTSVLLKRFVGKYYNEAVKVFSSDKKFFKQKLFLQINEYDKEYFDDLVKDVKHIDECHVVFVIEEEVINEWAENNVVETEKFLSKIKEHNFDICFRLKNRSLPWPNSLYQTFDYYMVDRHLLSGDERLDSSSAIKMLVNKLGDFHKPMIAVDIDNRTTFKILKEKEFTIFAGDYFAPESEGIIPPNLVKIGGLKK